jgi:hypothetical protein
MLQRTEAVETGITFQGAVDMEAAEVLVEVVALAVLVAACRVAVVPEDHGKSNQLVD